MLHSYVGPALRETVEYLRNGGREFYTFKREPRGPLFVKFLATPQYVQKMLQRPFLHNAQIYRQA